MAWVATLPARAANRLWLWWPAGAVVVGAILRLWTPSDDAATSICLFRRCTGVYCPGCGMTRAVAQMFKGRWEAGIAYHPLAPLVGFELLAGGVIYSVVRLGWLRAPGERLVTPILIANVLLLIGVWAVRLLTGSLP